MCLGKIPISLIFIYLSKKEMKMFFSVTLIMTTYLETIVRSGDRIWRYNEEYDGYGILLRRVGEEQHQSCLVLNSIEKPREIALLESPTGFVHSLQLTGLKQEAAQKSYSKKV